MLQSYRLIGKRYTRLVIERCDPPGGKRRTAEVVCDCGVKKTVVLGDLRSGKVKSCGCLRIDSSRERFTKHGGYQSRAYRIWQDIKRRNRAGIEVCPRWRESFNNFIADMGEPAGQQEMQRLDRSKGYSPENCRWVGNAEMPRIDRRERRKVIVAAYLAANGPTLSKKNRRLLLGRLSFKHGVAVETLRVMLWRHVGC